MSKRQVWDLPAMSEAELRNLVSRCNRQEKKLTAPYAKARRSWTDLRREAEAELARRFAN